MFRIDLNKYSVFLTCICFCLTFSNAMAGVKGQVRDEKGQAIPYAAIQWGDGKGVLADENGHFELPDHLNQSKIKVTAIGYEAKVITLSNHVDLTVKLTPLVHHLDEVVVTGNIDPQSARQSVYQVRTISKEIIQNRAASNLQEVLNTELGIRFSQDNALGSSNLEMLGLSGQNVKILIDGVPMVGRQGVNNEININQIDINQIERIEIVEGPMSVVYGADALAGVINIITKRPGDSKLLLNARVQEETVGQSYQPLTGSGNHIRSVQGQYRIDQNFSVSAGWTQNDFGGWKGDFEGRQYSWLPKTQNLGMAQLNFGSEGIDLSYGIDYLNESISSFGPENRVETVDSEFVTRRIMHRLTGSYALNQKLKAAVQAGYTDYQRNTITTYTNVRTGETGLSNAPGSQAVLNYNGLNVRLTSIWDMHKRLAWTVGVDFNQEVGSGERISSNEGINDLAFFISGEWKPTDSFSLRPGVRRTYNSAYEAPPLIPSINGRWDLSESLALKFGYARGFRAPSIRELYFDFFDASHAIVGNPDLQAETSHSYQASLSWLNSMGRNIKLESTINSFYNDIDNQITYGISPDDPRLTSLFNLENFRTGGAMFRNKLILNKHSMDFGISRIGRYNQISSEHPDLASLLWTTELNANIGVYLPFVDSHLNLFYKWTGALPAFVADSNAADGFRPVQLDGFHWMDLTMKKTLFGNMDLTFGARNLLDVRNVQSSLGDGSAHSGGASRPIGYGRSYFIGINYQLFK
ncbi:TonB-dependent receptor domain-containing protein [Belliella kenyensis]|uniref:TonB-dependent receptor domain-containing protein n=1 Tax=Belliella kenyensis TaxID=1472724 RepID=A0ABV8EQX8_9BACT|nr:TonB-dependent receptor [Belliella kenyensis]MCH7401484.1 TonB-dependent receptor [Belliella kenyensis]MDN3603235.1 TonB-dependent receptor [Belliella kenyensis]